ncbi:unnamed protein product [Phytophthora lilii]|uniref:Unnamed protein product n=1 Tax=Phytophthora lilii TaxID=2077276 RepID=A0A9W6XBX8_9STRA|nr:unnamed protein product [Phytophthora lilii]
MKVSVAISHHGVTCAALRGVGAVAAIADVALEVSDLARPLDIVQRLHETRSEGCSNAAFTGAAAGDHLDVIQWLRETYPALYDPEACLKAAQEHNSVAVIQEMKSQVRAYIARVALKTAAAKGYVEAVEALLPGPGATAEVFTVAAANGRAALLQFLIDKDYDDMDKVACGLDAGAISNAWRFYYGGVVIFATLVR